MARFKNGDSLTTIDLEHVLQSCPQTKSLFVGVFPLDAMSTLSILSRPALVVCNSAYSKSKGEHWYCFFLGYNNVEFFDSYGLPPSSPHLDMFIKLNSRERFSYNTNQLQSLTSSTCGKYVATYLYYRSIGHTLEQYLQLFRNRFPDRVVRFLFSKMFLERGSRCRVGDQSQRCYKYHRCSGDAPSSP